MVKGKHPRAVEGFDAKKEKEYCDSFSDSDIESMVFETMDIETADGCTVEPNGKCSHGYSSPLLILGYI